MNELGSIVRMASLLASNVPATNVAKDADRLSSGSNVQNKFVIVSALDSLEHIDVRSRQVIEKRLGLLGGEQQTLAAVGITLCLTRERVRQIENKVLKRLRTMFGNTFSQILKDKESSIFSELTSNSVIPDTDEKVLFGSLPPEVRLLVRILYKNSRTWLDTVATRVEDGWLLDGLPMALYLEAREFLTNRLKEIKLPCQLSNLLPSQEKFVNAVVEVIRLEKGIKIIDGYVFLRRSTRRPRRAMRVHRLMLRREFVDPMDLSELKETYLRTHLDDQCSARDLMIVLSTNPQLFLNQYEMGWLPFGAPLVITSMGSPCNVPEVAKEQVASAPPESVEDEDEGTDEEIETLRSTLAQILISNGPQSFNDLRRIFVAQVGGRYSKASVGPVLISTDEFVRIGPGIYAHRKQLADSKLLSDAASRLLLNKVQCEIFCRSIWAGESPQSYLLWSPLVQVQWADWCYESGEDKLLASLLAVCVIDEWPIKAGDKARWLRLQERLAFYTLEESPPILTERLPSFREFLAAVAHAVKAGKVSWLSANRVSGYRVDDRHSVSLLALMVIAEVIEPAMHWQHQHKVTDKSDKILRSILTSATHQAPVKWPMTLIISMRATFNSLSEPGWTEGETMCALLDAIQQDALRDDDLAAVVLTSNSKYEQLKKKLKSQIIFDNLRLRLAREKE